MSDAQNLIFRILERLGTPVNLTRLVKLTYFIDYTYFQNFGRTFTGLVYHWDDYGPNAVGHAIRGEANILAQKRIVQLTLTPNIYGGTTSNYQTIKGATKIALPPEVELIVADIVAQYGRLNTEQITAASKKTAPFQNAIQYQLLDLKQTNQVFESTADDYERYQKLVEAEGLISFEELQSSLV